MALGPIPTEYEPVGTIPVVGDKIVLLSQGSGGRWTYYDGPADRCYDHDKETVIEVGGSDDDCGRYARTKNGRMPRLACFEDGIGDNIFTGKSEYRVVKRPVAEPAPRRRIYLAGPMTGIPDFNFPAFNAAAKHLESEGWSVFNPASNFDGKTDLPREQYMRKDFEELLKADAIALLPGWQDSEGALAEAMMAKQLGLSGYFVETDGGHWGTVDIDLNVLYALKGNKAKADFEKKVAEIDASIAKPAMPAESVLQEAQRLVGGDRGADYGHPLDDYNKTGMMWGALLHAWAKEAAKHAAPIAIPADLSCLMMVAMKLSRQVNKRKRDNLVDGAGYLLCSAMCIDETERRLVGKEE